MIQKSQGENTGSTDAGVREQQVKGEDKNEGVGHCIV